MPQGWSFWIDRGGTFTDVVARRPDGVLQTMKLLSEDPARYEDAGLEAMRRFLDLDAVSELADAPVDAVRMGTTVATNALLERTGEPTLLVVTRGFADVLAIGYQQRPRLFELDIRLPPPLYADVLEARERVGADGTVLEPLDEASLAGGLAEARSRGLSAAAIVFLHGYRHPAHEAAAARLAAEAGFEQVSVSHEVSPLARVVPRGDTTVADAYLSPVLSRYVERIRRPLAGRRLLFMQSSGGLAEASRFRGRDSVLSGPAGGVVGMAAAGRRAGLERLIGFDMGGTSTDVCLFDGEFERRLDGTVAGIRIQAPMLAVHTVAAGGGSVLRLEDDRFQVGPASAGADPGPACYGKGGPLAVTDANLVLGRIQPEFLPPVFGPGGDSPLDRAAAEHSLEDIAARLEEAGRPMALEAIAEGFLEIAVERMARAVKQVSVRRGADPSAFTLCGFGGAAGQHACAVADALGIRRVLMPPAAGVLSAWGTGLADLVDLRQAPVQMPLAEVTDLRERFRQLEAKGRAALEQQGVPAGEISFIRRVRVRYAGSDTTLQVPAGSPDDMGTAFEEAHLERFGFAEPRQLVAESLELESRGGGRDPQSVPAPRSGDAGASDSHCLAWADGAWRRVPRLDRGNIRPGQTLSGPALIVEADATTWVAPGWTARVDDADNLLLERTGSLPRRDAGTAPDPVLLEVFNNRFMHVAEQMGGVLQNTAASVNIKERLDYSCAVFDAAGGLVANAPHMPVHLGSMGESVRAIAAQFGSAMGPGDSFVLNDPYGGGTHLPDVTVVTPYFEAGQSTPEYFLASRAHHADIGGMTPGSMPPESRHIDEEGVLIRGFRLVSGGRLDEAGIRALLDSGDWPARNPDQNLADLRAQLAANRRGHAELQKMIREFGTRTVAAYMGHIKANAAAAVTRAIAGLSPGRFSLAMDGGETVCVSVTPDPSSRRVRVDFTGTSAQSRGNLNAPAAVCRAAVLYVFRCLVDRDIPLNDGCLDPVDLVIPEASLLNPAWPAAVAGGNVETSQCVVDALFGALGVVAASQGTMNNVTFGNPGHQYYETLCGGAGAGPGFAGASAVHTHMTNSRLTDPEILELRHPVRVERFAVRRGSGGRGRYAGGDGVVRRLRFTEPVTVAVMSNRRRIPPFGLAGGAPGLAGRNALLAADGTVREMPGTFVAELEPGDALQLETPGGGGYGKPAGDGGS